MKPSLFSQVTAPNFAPLSTRCFEKCPGPHYMPMRDGTLRNLDGYVDHDLHGLCVCNPGIEVCSGDPIIIYNHAAGKMFKMKLENYLAVCLRLKNIDNKIQ